MDDEDWQFSEQDVAFTLGERVRMWSESERAWKVGTVRGLVWVPYQRSDDPEYREVIFDGSEERITCRASDLRCAPAGDAGPPATDDKRFFEPGDRVWVCGARGGAWRSGTVRQVIGSPGERVAHDEYELVVSYRVAFDDGGSGRYDPADMKPLG